MKPKYLINFISDYQQYSYYSLSVKNSHLSQSWIYGEAKKKSQGWEVVRAVIIENEKPIAIVQAWLKKFLFFTLCRISYGPLWIIENPSLEQIKNVFYLIKKQFGLQKLSVFSIAPNLENCPDNNKIMSDLGFYKRKSMAFESGLIDLTQTKEILRSKLRQNWRNQLTSSEKKGLSFQISQTKDDFVWIISCFKQLRKEKNFYGHSVYFLNDLYHCAFDCEKTLISIVSQNNERIAGMLFPLHGTSSVPLIIWVGSNGRKLNAGNFLLWNSILYAKEKGCLLFDLGGTNNSTAFKTGLPHTPYQMIGEYYGFI